MLRAADLAPDVFLRMGIDADLAQGGGQDVRSPIDGRVIGSVLDDDPLALEDTLGRADTAFEAWRTVPAPRRGELVRRFGEVLRANKEAPGPARDPGDREDPDRKGSARCRR